MTMTDTEILNWIERNEAMLTPEVAENGLCIGWFCNSPAIGFARGGTPREAVRNAAEETMRAGSRSFAPKINQTK